MSKKDCSDRSNGRPPRSEQDQQLAAIRYRAQAFDLRQLAMRHRSAMMRRRLLEIAAELDQLAAQLKAG